MSTDANGNPPAVLLGGGVIAVSAARALGAAGVPVYALGDAETDGVRFSRHCVEFTDVGSGAGVQERMLARLLAGGPRESVLFPCSDAALELLALNRAALEDHGYRLPEARDDVVLAMLDKQKTYELAHEAGIGAPRTTIVREAGDLHLAEEFGFPCALKPVLSHRFAEHFGSRKKLVVARDFAELERSFDTIASLGIELMLTEIIPGADDRFYSILTYMTPAGGPLFLLTKRKLRQRPTGFGVGSYHVTDWNPALAELGESFLRAVGLVGLANLEFKHDPRDDSYKVIECNHRLTITSELAKAAGINSALVAYQRALGRPTPERFAYRRGVSMLFPFDDFRAFLAARKDGKPSLLSWVGSVARRQHFPVFSWSDPGPALAQYGIRGRRALRRAATRVSASRSTPRLRPIQAAPHETGSNGRAVSAHRRGVDPLTHTLYRLACRGKLGTEIAIRAEMAREAGLRHVWRRSLEQTKRRAVVGGDGMDAISHVYRNIWRAAAAELDAEIEELPAGVLEIRKGGASAHVRQKHVGLNDEAAIARAADKALVHRLLGDADLPMPEYVEFDLGRLSEAAAFLLATPGPCVVKAALGEGGYGVTCGVRSRSQLMRASVRATRVSTRILIEHEVPGDFYRFLIFDGAVLSVVRRLPPTVVGDGVSTVEELVYAENRARAAARIALPPIRIDLDCLMTLKGSGLALRTVVPDGIVVPVKTVVSQNGPRDNEVVRDEISAALEQEAVDAAEAVGLRLAGVDLVTTTLRESLAASGGAILEVNGAPGLTYHYEVADDSDIDPVAVPLLQELLLATSPRPVPVRPQPSKT